MWLNVVNLRFLPLHFYMTARMPTHPTVSRVDDLSLKSVEGALRVQRDEVAQELAHTLRVVKMPSPYVVTSVRVGPSPNPILQPRLIRLAPLG